MNKYWFWVIVALLFLVPSASFGVPQYAVENVREIFSVQGEEPFSTITWDQTGQKIAVVLYGSELWYCNLNNLAGVTRLTGLPAVNINGLSSIAFSPDGTGVLLATYSQGDYFEHATLALASTTTPGQVELGVLKPSDFPAEFGFDDTDFSVRGPCVVTTPKGDKLFCVVLHLDPTPPPGTHAESIFWLDIDSAGHPIKESAKKIVDFQNYNHILLVNPVFLPGGALLAEQPWMDVSRQLWVFDVASIVASGSGSIPFNGNPDNVNSFRVDIPGAITYVTNISGSSDSTLLFYVQAAPGYVEGDPWSEASFQITSVSLDSVMAGSPEYQAISCVYPLGPMFCSPGGIRLAWFSYGSESTNAKMYLGTLTVSDQVSVEPENSGSVVVTNDFRLRDGSFGEFFLPAGTILEGISEAPTVSLSTPVDPLCDPAFADTAGLVPVQRVITGLEGVTIVSPEENPATMTVGYNPKEVPEAQESTLVMSVLAADGAKAMHLVPSTNNLVENKIVGKIELAGKFVVTSSSAIDSDSDGLTDEVEAGLGTDPQNPDTDGDGLTDGEEVLGFGTDPLTPTPVDALSPIGLGLLLLLMVISVGWIFWQRQQA